MIFSSCNTPTAFYVYAYLREDSTPYYIGKGKDRRAWSTQKVISVPEDSTRIQIIACNLSEPESLILEKKLISYYGRKDLGTGILRNLTDGGEGSSGLVRSQSQKDKQRAKMKGREGLKGSMNGMCDLTIYTFRHDNGAIERCTKNELYSKYTLLKVNVHAMFGNRPRQQSVKGWRLVKDLVVLRS